MGLKFNSGWKNGPVSLFVPFGYPRSSNQLKKLSETEKLMTLLSHRQYLTIFLIGLVLKVKTHLHLEKARKNSSKLYT